jgi:glucokinase
MLAERPEREAVTMPEALNGRPVYVGIEIGERGAWMKASSAERTDQRPQLRWRERFVAPPEADELLDRLGEGVKAAAGGAPLIGVGVAVWGIAASKLDEQALWWSDAAFLDRARAMLGAPVRWRTAVDAAALAEAHMGAGQGASPVVYVHLGREVLASVLWEGRLAPTAHNLGGQLGHWRVAEDGPRCGCGVAGHLNPICSSQSFVRLAIGLASQDDDTLAAVRAITAGRAESLTAANVVTLAAHGAAPLRDLVERAADALGQALGRLTLIIDPLVITLGGPLGVAGGLFLDWTRERMITEIRSTRSASQFPLVSPALLEPSSATIGAWLVGHEAVGD